MTKNNPSVSVVIPTYNRAGLLGRAVQSVLNQTFQDFEIIIVDDGSTDKTEEVVKSFKNELTRYIRHEKNRGANAARNTGIKAARGEYVAFQDSGDEWLPQKLEKQMKVFENASPDVGVVYTGFWRIIGDKKTYEPSSKVAKKEGDIHSILLYENFIDTPTSVVRKACFRKVGMFDERLPRLQEWELWIRISKFYRFKFIDGPLVNTYLHPDSISLNQEATIRARKFILEKHFEEIQRDAEKLGKHYYEIGVLLCLNGKIREGRSYLLKAIKASAHGFNVKLLLKAFIPFFSLDIYSKAVAVHSWVEHMESAYGIE